ncbi:MAG: hypothetical protein AAFX95_12515 [Cyanobacteria bacterium J06639_16]
MTPKPIQKKFIMKGFIKNKTIVLTDPLPENFHDGDEVEISIVRTRKKTYPFPVFDLGIKDDYLKREHIYESDSNLP